MNAQQPLVMCLTNTVAANFTANVLLAIGAKPAMVEDPVEARELVRASDAVLVNVGTVNKVQAEVMRAAIDRCRAHGTPWVLDPVAHNWLAYRRALVAEFLGSQPSLVRGNAAEIDALPPHPGIPTLATGVVDRIVSGDGVVEEISGGTPLLTRVTATGCAQGAICAAFLGRGFSPLDACRIASRLMKHAGALAAAKSCRPGSFAAALLDALDELKDTI